MPTLTIADKLKLHSNGEIVPIECFAFSGGEVQVRILGALSRAVKITAHVRSSDDLMALLLLSDAARRCGVESISLVLPYLPYARQDRVCASGEALSLRVMCDILNAQNYNSVEVWDVHSGAALALLNRVKNVHCAILMEVAIPPDGGPVLVAPDAGAIKKVVACATAYGLPYVRADKTRDPATGEITGTVVYSEHIGQRDFLIVDDICDGGRTFIELAKKLRPLTDGAVNLYVTHGIFSKGTDVFDGIIDHVFVANPFTDSLPKNFTHLKG